MPGQTGASLFCNESGTYQEGRPSTTLSIVTGNPKIQLLKPGLRTPPGLWVLIHDRGLVNGDGEKEVSVEMEHCRIQGQGASEWDCRERLR
jgi:hypothetical protein